MRLDAPQRGKTLSSESKLEGPQIAAAHRQIMREIVSAGRITALLIGPRQDTKAGGGPLHQLLAQCQQFVQEVPSFVGPRYLISLGHGAPK